MRWPWQPREYVAVVGALRYAEEALRRREAAARAQRGVIQQVRRELEREDRDGD